MGKPTKVEDLHGGQAECIVNRQGIIEVTVGRLLSKKQHRMLGDRSGANQVSRGLRGSGRPTESLQLVGVARRPIDKKIRERIQLEEAGRWCSRKKRF